MRVFKDMEDEFYAEVRAKLLRGLVQCKPGEQRIFKLMYAPEELSVEEKENRRLSTVVLEMDRNKLDWAMQQVQTTLDKRDR